MSEYYERPNSLFLRSTPKRWARSPYAVEVNPWTPRGDIEAAIIFRGSIVSALGNIETRLSELALRCSRLEQYAALRSKLPYGISKKIAFLREAFDIAPLNKFQKTANQFFDRVERQSDIRNLVAHARMEVQPDFGVTFYHFTETKDHGLLAEREHLHLQQLELKAWRISRLSRLCQRLISALDSENIIPEVDFFERKF